MRRAIGGQGARIDFNVVQNSAQAALQVQLVKEVLVAPELPETPPRVRREVPELGPDSLPEDYARTSSAIRRRRP